MLDICKASGDQPTSAGCGMTFLNQLANQSDCLSLAGFAYLSVDGPIEIGGTGVLVELPRTVGCMEVYVRRRASKVFCPHLSLISQSKQNAASCVRASDGLVSILSATACS